MRQLLASLMTLLTSFSMGVAPVDTVVKVYTPDAYYSSVSQEVPDYRAINSMYNAATVTTDQGCEKTTKQLNPGTKPFMPTNTRNFLWLWAINMSSYDTNGDKVLDKEVGFLEAKSDKNTEGYQKVIVGTENAYMWKVPANTQLVSFANTYLSSKEPTLDSPYPLSGYTRGMNMSIINVTVNDGYAYKANYMSMERWWCDIGKKKADTLNDGKATQPLFGHDVEFSNEDTFYSGSVIGIAGSTGVLSTDGTVVMVAFYKCPMENGEPNKDWTNIGIEDFYTKE